MEQLNAILGKISGMVWGPPMLILLVGTGLYLTLLLNGLQFRHLPHALKLIFHKDEAQGDISHFQALMTALAATVGNGNIVGVASAIILGGPGAVFWMWITGLVGMATKYSEAVLAVKYREERPYGMSGGPMYYISKGCGLPRLGVVFAVFTAFAAFGIGNLFQVNSVVENFESAFGFNRLATAIFLMLITGAVTIGGIRWIGRVTAVLVPIMIIGYFGAGLIVLIVHAGKIPGALGEIFYYAFTPHAAFGGTIGSLVRMAIQQGVRRGVFSNESGLGSAPIAAAAAKTKDPATQALVSMTQTFIDTIIVCTMTALVVLICGDWSAEGASKAALTGESFSVVFGHAGIVIVALASAVFAYSTLIGWCYYGEKAVEYLGGEKLVMPYRVVFALIVVLGAKFGTGMIINLSDIMNGLMALPNLVALLLLAKVVKDETEKYFDKY